MQTPTPMSRHSLSYYRHKKLDEASTPDATKLMARWPQKLYFLDVSQLPRKMRVVVLAPSLEDMDFGFELALNHNGMSPSDWSLCRSLFSSGW